MTSRKRDRFGSMTLVEKAVGFKGYTPVVHGVGNEHYELAAAWVNGEVTNSQVAHALGMSKTDKLGLTRQDNLRAVYRMASYLREAVRRDKLSITN